MIFAEFERDLINECTPTAMQHKRRGGGHTGGLEPYGWCGDANGDQNDRLHRPPPPNRRSCGRRPRCAKAGHRCERSVGALRRGVNSRLAGGRSNAKTVRDLLEARAA